MRYDLSPLFRSSVGFDSLSRLIDAATRQTDSQSYPPYNIEKLGEDSYRIAMAVAGFRDGDIEMVQQQNSLVVKGKVQDETGKTVYLHRGIAGRAFEHRFQLADHIRVTGAVLEHGLLHIDLVREVPEAMKPRTIAIGTAAIGTAAIGTASPLDAKAA